MYGQRPLTDLRWVLRGIVANQIARFFPDRYLRLTGQTGRGAAESSARQIADYFWSCFYDDFEILGIPASDIGRYLKGKTVLEYGPGDVPAVAFLMLAHGADAAVCVDRFELYRPSPASAEVLRLLLDDLEGAARLRGEVCFRMPLDPASGLAEPSFRYVCHDYGLSGLRDEADLSISRAALGYAKDLSATLAAIRAAGGRGPARFAVVLSCPERSGSVVARLLDGPAQADQLAGGAEGVMAGERSLFKSIGSNWGVTIMTILMTFILTPFIIHRLGTEAYGTWALITSITGYLGLLVLGVPMASVRYFSEY